MISLLPGQGLGSTPSRELVFGLWPSTVTYAGDFGGALADLALAASGRLGCGGDVVSQLDASGFAGAGREGKQASPQFSLDEVLAALIVGQQGFQGPLSTSVSVVQDAEGVLGSQGTLAATISLALLLSEAGVCEGSFSSLLELLAPEIQGGAGVDGVTYTQLEPLAPLFEGQVGSSGQLTLTISVGQELVGKLGVTAAVAAIMQNMGLVLVDIGIAPQIRQILLSTKTGRMTIVTRCGTAELTSKTGGVVFGGDNDNGQWAAGSNWDDQQEWEDAQLWID